jgi:hypothetical protein
MPISSRRPFTEMVEMLQNELIREAATNEESKYKGLVNQVYTNELISILPERYIRKEAFVKTVADYTTGTVTVGSGTVNIIGASTAWTSANSDDLNISVDGYDQTYRMTFAAGTSLTFQSSLTWTGASGSGLTYTLTQDRYSLASDFGYLVKDSPSDPNAVWRYINGVKIFLDPWTNEEYDRQFTSTVSSVYAYTTKFSAGTTYMHLQSNPDDAENIGYTYIPVLTQLREHTKGTATITTGTSLVLTTNGSLTTSLDTTRNIYFRADDDGTGSASEWYLISTVTDDSTATLNTAYTGTSSGVGISYTIAEVSEWPARFDDVIMYKAAWIADPDGAQAEKWLGLTTDAINLEMASETKRKRSSTLMHFPGTRGVSSRGLGRINR